MLEMEDLLAPISQHAPAGEDLSFSVEFDAIQEARRADDPTLDQGEWVTDIKTADWNAVWRSCTQLLQARTKDLRLGGWLTEAGVQLHGFSGLAHGLRVVAGLCDRYWDELHPLAIDGDQEERIGNLGWLLANALQWLHRTPIVQGPQGRFSLADFDAAHARGRNEAARGDHDQPGLETLEAARRDTPHDFYRQLLEALPDCAAALRELQAVVDARLGMDGPGFGTLRDALDDVHRTVQRFARDAGLLPDGDVPGEGLPAGVPASEPPVPPRGPGGPIGTRKEALAQLRQVAEFFRRTEPHSPVAYLAEKAARWGEMPLHVWLRRVIKDDATLSQVEELLDMDQNGQ